MKRFAMIAVVTATALLSTSALAHGPYRGGYPAGGWYHGGYPAGAWYRGGYYGYGPGVGVVIGGPVWGPGYYPPYYYYPPYPPAVVSVPASPPVYIEQGQPGPAPSNQAGAWYYCPESKGYYPYVNQCPSGWQSVPATPPPAVPAR